MNLYLEELIPEIQQDYYQLNLCTFLREYRISHKVFINTQLLLLYQECFYNSAYHS